MLPKKFLRPSCMVLTLGCVAVATIFRAFIEVALNEQIPYTPFYPAVMVSALYCGSRWGLVSTVLSALAASFWLTPMGRPLIAELNDLAGMGLFLLVCTLIVWLSARVRSHREEAERAAEERQQLLLSERAARKEAERANRAKDDFLAAVSHELRTPMNSIFGWVELLRHHGLSAEESELAMESIERSAKVQTQLVNDLVELSRIRMGKLRLDVQAVCISEIVQSAVQTVLPTAKAKGIEIDAPRQPSVGPILGDPDRLHQVVWNLLSNALKFTPSGGAVRIEVVDNGDHAQCVITDSGEGIDPSFLPIVFDRFQQETSKRNQGGLGLGLSIVKELVELHGGNVGVFSGGKGMGSQFKVMLPKHSVRAVANDEIGLSPPSSSADPALLLPGKHILIVDDDCESRSLVETVLRKQGAEITSAQSAAEAAKVLSSCTPDILICDLGMPEVDGFELIKLVRRPECRASSMPAVALTAYTSETTRRRAVESGFQVHLGKPVEPQELVGAVVDLTQTNQ